MHRIFSVLSVLGFSITLSACLQQSNGGTVAILDLQRVADETGYARTINQQLDGLRANLQTELTKVQSQLNNALSDNQKKLEKNPNETQKEELKQQILNAQLQLQKAEQQAAGVVQRERDNLVVQLHDLLRPYAKKIANERGMKVVIIRSQAMVFDHDPSSDITDEVISTVVQSKADFKPKIDSIAAESATNDERAKIEPMPKS